MKYLEDFRPGRVFEATARPMSAASIKAFAREWDPQTLHLDEAHATAIHGSLIASGFQTILHVFQPLMHQVFTGIDNIGGLGIDRLRWHRPVRPDEPLAVRMELTQVRPSSSQPGRGVIAYEITARNPAGETVLSLQAATLIRCRPHGAAG